MIGILGGIGSGKSSVVRRVSGLKLQIIDADRIGHDLLSDCDIQSRIRGYFGNGVFSGPETIDRSRLARRVFGETAAHHLSLKELNEILHPAIRREIHSQIDTASTETDVVIIDAALLLESGWNSRCNWLVFVDTPLSVRLQRVRENRGWSAEELARREATQWDIQRKKARADFVVDNSGSIDAAAAQMKQILTSILSQTA